MKPAHKVAAVFLLLVTNVAIFYTLSKPNKGHEVRKAGYEDKQPPMPGYERPENNNNIAETEPELHPQILTKNESEHPQMTTGNENNKASKSCTPPQQIPSPEKPWIGATKRLLSNPNFTKRTVNIKVDFYDFRPTNDKPFWPFYNLLKDIYNLNYTEDPDFLFYTAKGGGLQGFKKCVRVYLCGENAVPNFNKCDYAISYNPITFDDRHFIYKSYMYTEVLFGPWDFCPKIDDRNLTKRRFCSFIYTHNNPAYEGIRKRIKFYELLSKYKKIDSPGKVYHNINFPTVERTKENEGVEQWRLDKHAFIRDRKFVITFENARSNGYITEKLPDALRRHTIPIYFGDPNVGKIYNKKAFIDASDYPSLENVVDKVIELDNDDDAYMAMLNEPPFVMENYQPTSNLQDYLVHIIENGKVFLKDPRDFAESRR